MPSLSFVLPADVALLHTPPPNRRFLAHFPPTIVTVPQYFPSLRGGRQMPGQSAPPCFGSQSSRGSSTQVYVGSSHGLPTKPPHSPPGVTQIQGSMQTVPARQRTLAQVTAALACAVGDRVSYWLCEGVGVLRG